LSLQNAISAALPIFAMMLLALAMIRSHQRQRTAVIIGACALAGMGLGIGAGLLFLTTPEAAGRLGAVMLLLGISGASVWEMVMRRE
jgi:lipopolysaccharide export LptBFGC system permease protein LptF